MSSRGLTAICRYYVHISRGQVNSAVIRSGKASVSYKLDGGGLQSRVSAAPPLIVVMFTQIFTAAAPAYPHRVQSKPSPHHLNYL